MRRLTALFGTLLILLIAAATTAGAQTPRLEWDPNTDENLGGYIVYYGTKSGASTNSVDVGNTTRWSLDGLQAGLTYYLTVRAYSTAGVLSSPSQEVSYSVPQRTELIWQHTLTGGLAAWQMEGTRQVAGASLAPSAVDDTDWRIVATGDFDHDGRRDLVWQHADGTIATWLMRGISSIDGRLFEPSTTGDPGWRVVAAADMNADGACDLIWRHRTSGAIAVWRMDGTRRRDGVVMSPSTVADLDWEIVGAADFNGDRKTDLLWRHKAQGWVSVWLMNGVVMREGRSLIPNGTPDLAWSIRAVNDLNGDRKPDLIWQHSDGHLAAWIMDGLTNTAGMLLTPSSVLDPNWTIVGAR
jgi:hypothetical protein